MPKSYVLWFGCVVYSTEYNMKVFEQRESRDANKMTYNRGLCCVKEVSPP